jgi:parvulin-like peptidyl-prolyl isomerase
MAKIRPEEYRAFSMALPLPRVQQQETPVVVGSLVHLLQVQGVEPSEQNPLPEREVEVLGGQVEPVQEEISDDEKIERARQSLEAQFAAMMAPDQNQR